MLLIFILNDNEYSLNTGNILKIWLPCLRRSTLEFCHLYNKHQFQSPPPPPSRTAKMICGTQDLHWPYFVQNPHLLGALVFCLHERNSSGIWIIMSFSHITMSCGVFIREEKAAHRIRFCYDYLIISFHLLCHWQNSF